MSLSSAMNVGVTGLGINSEAITVVGNNIANVNTIGFKEGRTLFSDLLSSNINNGQVGRGGQIQTVQNMFSQGSFENTTSDFDLALQGEGMFVVQDATGQNYYTRAGAFDFNPVIDPNDPTKKLQILTNPDGYKVMGYGIIPATGLSDGALGVIDKTSIANLPAKPTTATNFVLNLNSAQSMPGSAPTSTMNLLGNFGSAAAPAATTTNIYDEFGNAHLATITWGGASPSYTYSIDIAGTQAGTPGSAAAPITGTLAFPAIINPATQNILFTNGAATLPLSISFSNMQNTAIAVAPSVTQNGTAGQPTGTVAVAGGTSSANTTITTGDNENPATTTINNISTSGLSNGMLVTGTGIPVNTTIANVGPNSITLSKVSTSTATGVQLTFYNNTQLGTTNTTAGTEMVVTGIDTTNLYIGMTVTGDGIPGGTTIIGMSGSGPGNSIVLSANASIIGVNVPLGFSGNSMTMVDSSGTVHAGNMEINGANWTATVNNSGTSSYALTGDTDTTAPGTAVTNLTTTNLKEGMFVTGSGIPANTYIVGIPIAGTITLSRAATATAAGVALTFTGKDISTVSGTIATGGTGSTWTQNSPNISLGGSTQNVKFDFAQATSAATAPTISANGFDITNPSTTSNFSNSIQVFDSQGNAHDLITYYRKVGANSWEYHARIPDAISINGMAGNSVISGSLSFDANGVLSSQTPAGATAYNVQFGGGVASQPLNIDFGSGLSSQNASPSLVTTTTQNGYAAGSLTSTKIDDKGYVTASYTNGQIQRVAQVALARFAALSGLEKIGNSIFMATTKSGDAQIGTASDYNYKLFTKSLEQSNVDMATQLVNMIKLQRAYSGNSKTITSSDEMMQETLSLKR